MVVSALKLVLFFVSNYGFWEFFRHKFKFEISFLPVYTIAFQFMVLFFAGLFNFLTEAVVGLYLFGLLMAAYSIKKRHSRALVPYLGLPYYVLFFGCFCLLVAVRGKIYEHYDNFSHWALVVRSMLDTGRFPNFRDDIIIFQSYPLGTAAYIFYFCKLTSRAESFQMMAQAYMMLSCMLPCFSFLKKNRAMGTLLFVLTGNYLLCYNISIYNLLVDTVLPLAGMATVLFIVVHGRTEDADWRSNIYLLSIPMLCWTAQIKNSGLFFCAIAIIVMLSPMCREPKCIAKKLVASISPIVVSMLWSRHCDYVFPTYSTSKHAMHFDNFLSVFTQKEQEDLIHILRGVVRHAFLRKELLYMLIFIGILALISWVLVKEKRKNSRNLFLAAVCTYATYVVCVAGMYMFSMPGNEASRLAGLARYLKTIDIAIYILILCHSFDILSSAERRQIGISVGCVLILIQLGLSLVCYGGIVTVYQQYSAPLRTVMQDFLKENPVPYGKSYLICVPGSNSDYYKFLGRYLLNTSACHSLSVTDKSELDYYWDKFEYVLILDEDNPQIEAWVQENAPGQIGLQVLYNER